MSSGHGIDHGAMRVVRGLLLALSSAALAVSAHALAGGALPDVAMTLLLVALIGWTATALAAKTGGALGALVVLGTGQLVMHLLLSTLVTHSEPHGRGAEAVNGWVMTATHAGATMVTALLVSRAESLLRAVAGAMRLLSPVLWRSVPVMDTVAAPTVAATPEIGQLVSVLLRHVCSRRGPPVHS